mgnify:CR=1 FL=1
MSQATLKELYVRNGAAFVQAIVMYGPGRDFTYTATTPSNSSITYSDTTKFPF